jgi:hypothetical protein
MPAHDSSAARRLVLAQMTANDTSVSATANSSASRVPTTP